MVATCIGDKGILQYKPSRQSNTMIDSAVKKVFDDANVPHKLREFAPLGSDERQYCSPGINLPIGCLTRTPYGEFEEYHTSADNLDFIDIESMDESFDILKEIIF